MMNTNQIQDAKTVVVTDEVDGPDPQQALAAGLTGLQDQLQQGKPVLPADFERLYHLLDGVALPEKEYEFARAMCRNAERYVAFGERSSARYTLRWAARKLRVDTSHSLETPA